MSVPVWCADLAARFWAASGPPPPFPRDLRPAVRGGPLPLNVIDLPGLTLAAVRGWFADRDFAFRLDEPDRRLRACLVATHGDGYAFVDAADPPAERRFSLAHEVGHFLRDYWHPRETAVRRLGDGVRGVLDGRRRPTPEERWHALLRNAVVGPFAHLLRRDDGGRPRTPAERAAEAAADRLAFELLAPAAAVGGVVDVATLEVTFGLPAEPAGRYAAALNPAAEIGREVARLLG